MFFLPRVSRTSRRAARVVNSHPILPHVVFRACSEQGGQAVEVIVLLHPPISRPRAHLPVGQLRRSGLIGLWQDRNDIDESSTYARQLRQQAQGREDIRL
jgi:hypothetical protein